MDKTKQQIVKELRASREGLDEARKLVDLKDETFKSIRKEHDGLLTRFREKMSDLGSMILDECGKNQQLMDALRSIVARCYYERDPYQYYHPFEGVYPDRGTYSRGVSFLDVDCREDSILEKIDAIAADGKPLIKFPCSRPNNQHSSYWESDLLRTIAFFYYSRKESIEDAIQSAKRVIEENPYLAEDNYSRALAEYLFCFDEQEIHISSEEP